MAVPTSGVLTLEGIAQEALYGTYGTGVITPPIHLYDLVNGGDSAGSGDSYPVVNEDCIPNPATRLPFITTSQITNITETSATTGGENIAFSFKSPITSRGIQHSTNVSGPFTTIDMGAGSVDFTTTITGLTSATNYFARAFATNILGTGYGETLSFFTGTRTLIVSAVSVFPGFPLVPKVTNETSTIQAITFSFTFVSQSGGVDSQLSYEGTNISAGFTFTKVGNLQPPTFEPLDYFTVTGGSSNTIQFKYTLLTAAQDAVPAAPDNSVTVSRVAPSCTLSTSLTTVSPTNIAGDNGKLVFDYSGVQGNLQFKRDNLSYVTIPGNQTSGTFTINNVPTGSGTLVLRTINAWPQCINNYSYNIASVFSIQPTNVPSNNPEFSVIGTTGAISTRVSTPNGATVLTTTSNPVDVSGLATAVYYVNVTQTNPSTPYPQVTIFVN